MGKFTITYSRTIPKGEGKFGSFEKMELTREFETGEATEAVAAAQCKAFVLNQLGLFADAEAQLQLVFAELRHWREDIDEEIASATRRKDQVERGVRVVSPLDTQTMVTRMALVGLGFDIFDIYQAEKKAGEAKP